jgi:hypothetical protein
VSELWQTDVVSEPTWADQPVERSRLPGPGAIGCQWDYVEWDATSVVQQALTTMEATITLALRMSEDHQGDTAYGRRYASNPILVVQYNRPPDVPTDLSVNAAPCTDGDRYVYGAPRLRARVTDQDQNNVYARFAVWPAERPAERREFHSGPQASGTVFELTPPSSLFSDGAHYEWAVQGDDGDDLSAWSAPCRFIADFTRPAVEPSVVSTTYPERPHPGGGGAGIPGEFTFDANGVDDVVGFRYGPGEAGYYVAADALGGGATITYTPMHAGPNSLVVHSVDRAGNMSPARRYDFFVLVTDPSVWCTLSDPPLGAPVECTFTPRMEDVVSYTYRLADGPETTIPAGPDGSALVAVTPPNGFTTLTVFSTTSTDTRSGLATEGFFVDALAWADCAGEPRVGQPLECLLQPYNMVDVGQYQYRLNDGSEMVVPADANGTVQITIVPDRVGRNVLTTSATTNQGLPSGTWENELYATG